MSSKGYVGELYGAITADGCPERVRSLDSVSWVSGGKPIVMSQRFSQLPEVNWRGDYVEICALQGMGLCRLLAIARQQWCYRIDNLPSSIPIAETAKCLRSTVVPMGGVELLWRRHRLVRQSGAEVSLERPDNCYRGAPQSDALSRRSFCAYRRVSEAL